VVGLVQKQERKMSAKTPENVIIRAMHEAFIKYPEGDGGQNLDYQWIQPEQSSHVAKAIILELAANGFEIVKKGAKAKTPVVAEDIADRLNEDDYRKEQDKWSA
jgi:hypothetical protein